jgi:hypothetical protein
MFFWALAKIEVALLFPPNAKFWLLLPSAGTFRMGPVRLFRYRFTGETEAADHVVKADRVVFIVVARQRRRVVAEPEYVGAVVVSGGRDDARGSADQRGGNDFGHTGSAQGRIDGQAVRRFARLLLRLAF